MKQSEKRKDSVPIRPDIYMYHDDREFLRDWLKYLKATMIPKFSVRRLAQLSEVSESYLSMVLAGTRMISRQQMDKILPFLELDVSERSYLQWLTAIHDASSPEERLEVLKKIQRFRQYRELNPLEIETYHYLTNWHYVAVRELATLPEFQSDPKWIQERIKYHVPLSEIKKALEFLVTHGFLELQGDGSILKPDKRIHCKTGVLKPALTKFHKEMLSMAWESIDKTDSEERNISAHTCAIPSDKVAAVKEIMDEARAKIIALAEESGQCDAVYHFSFLAFPLTYKVGKE